MNLHGKYRMKYEKYEKEVDPDQKHRRLLRLQCFNHTRRGVQETLLYLPKETLFLIGNPLIVSRVQIYICSQDFRTQEKLNDHPVT